MRERSGDVSEPFPSLIREPGASGPAAAGVVRRGKRNPLIGRACQESGLPAARMPRDSDARGVNVGHLVQEVHDPVVAPGPGSQRAEVGSREGGVEACVTAAGWVVRCQFYAVEDCERVASPRRREQHVIRRIPPAPVAVHDGRELPGARRQVDHDQPAQPVRSCRQAVVRRSGAIVT